MSDDSNPIERAALKIEAGGGGREMAMARTLREYGTWGASEAPNVFANAAKNLYMTQPRDMTPPAAARHATLDQFAEAVAAELGGAYGPASTEDMAALWTRLARGAFEAAEKVPEGDAARGRYEHLHGVLSGEAARLASL